jgi:anti-anti-sigma factor
LSEGGTLQVEEHGNVRVVRLRGEHDLSTVAALRRVLDDTGIAAPIVVDLTEVRFIDSSVIGIVIGYAQTTPTTSLVAPAGGHVAAVLRTVEIGQTMRTYASVLDAVAAAGSDGGFTTHG